MLSAEEKKFLEYWEKNRDRENKWTRKISYGAPWGLVFALPMLLAVIFHGWYKNMIPITRGQIVLITITVIGIAIFYAYFRQQFRWEHNEQFYEELKLREDDDAAN